MAITCCDAIRKEAKIIVMRSIFYLVVLATSAFIFSAAALAEEPGDLDLSFADEDKKVEDNANQSLNAVASSGPDKNMNYADVYSKIELESLPKAVAGPALGTRGYRPNLVGTGYGERTPGVGAFLEYSFNRVGMGINYSYKFSKEKSQAFLGAFATYRFLPFDVSPYMLLGGGTVSHEGESFGAQVGAGLEARIYYGLTLIAGYGYFSAVKRGFAGGAVAWGF